MQTEYFVKEDSIVREIWGKSDTILLIFAGASAEFALNKAVDWLYYTGKLPEDPLGRLFSTVSYARKIVFAEKHPALKAIENINHIHASVESNREKSIPDWAYRDVLFMLIDYSIRAYELLERKLSVAEKEEVYRVFYELGSKMQIKELPSAYQDFQVQRKLHLQQHLYSGEYTRDLYRQYRKHLGFLRYRVLIETQILILPTTVRKLLSLRTISLLNPAIIGYKFSRKLKLDSFIKAIILPSYYEKEIKALDHVSA